MPRLRFTLLLALSTIYLAFRFLDLSAFTQFKADIKSTQPQSTHSISKASSVVHNVQQQQQQQQQQPLNSPHQDTYSNKISQKEQEPREPYLRRIIAVGDLHGDYGNALKVLQMAGIADIEGNWAGGTDLFVQTGDIIDRYLLCCLYILVVTRS